MFAETIVTLIMLEDLNHHALGFVTWLDWSSLSSYSYDDSVKVTNSREKGRKFKYKRKINVKIGKSRCHHWKESKHTLISTKYFLLHIYAICSRISPIILESYLNRIFVWNMRGRERDVNINQPAIKRWSRHRDFL